MIIFYASRTFSSLVLKSKQSGVLATAERGAVGAAHELPDAAVPRLVGAIASNISLAYLAIHGIKSSDKLRR